MYVYVCVRTEHKGSIGGCLIVGLPIFGGLIQLLYVGMN